MPIDCDATQLMTCGAMLVGQSVKHHLLSSYYHATLAVMLAQFSSRGFADGRAGVVRLAETSTYIKVVHVHASSRVPAYTVFCVCTCFQIHQGGSCSHFLRNLYIAMHFPFITPVYVRQDLDQCEHVYN